MIEIDSTELSIYVSSSDKFEWLWPAFFYYFDRFWPDCPYTRYLGTESRDSYGKDFITLKSGNAKTWGEVTTLNLLQIRSKYIIFLLDDYLLQRMVDTTVVQKVLQNTEKIGAKYVKLTENHRTGVILPSEVSKFLFTSAGNAPFSISLQAAIWDREFFMNLLKSNESPWDFERNAIKRLLDYKDIYFLKKPLFDINFGGIMHHGLVERKFYKRISKDGVVIDKNYVMTRRQQTAKLLEDIMNNLNLQKFVPCYARKLIKTFLGVW